MVALPYFLLKTKHVFPRVQLFLYDILNNIEDITTAPFNAAFIKSRSLNTLVVALQAFKVACNMTGFREMFISLCFSVIKPLTVCNHLVLNESSFKNGSMKTLCLYFVVDRFVTTNCP